MNRLFRCVLALLALHTLHAPAVAGDPPAPVATAPVFYERYPADLFWVGDELDLLREGRVRVQHFEPRDATEFNWERDSFADYTWWMQMQELRFLLPALASTSSDDQRIARAWFMRWYAQHMVPEPQTGSWGEAITIGYRAMVLVRLLESEEQREAPDPDVIRYLRETILAHQQDLAQQSRFNELTNHAFIASLGLFETTRVLPDSALAALALSRLETVTARAVSRAGIEKEQSPAYHFVVLNWLDRIAGYFESLAGAPRDVAPRIASTVVLMRRAGYFLQDHAGRMPPIGDTDSVFVDMYSPGFRVDAKEIDNPGLYDTDSGYAIYKGAPGRDCRYVVFRIPDERLDMRRHWHDDALSVYFSHAGETILGDSGRYSYSSSPARAFTRSSCAHNTIVSEVLRVHADTPNRIARDAAELSGRAGRGWSAAVAVGATSWTREVRVPDPVGQLRVVDRLEAARSAPGGAEDVVMLWHLGSDVTGVVAKKTRDDREYQWSLDTKSGQRIRLTISSDRRGRSGIVSTELVRGLRDPLLGWYSPAQDVLRPVTTIVVRVRRDPAVSITTEIRVETGGCTAAGASRAVR